MATPAKIVVKEESRTYHISKGNIFLRAEISSNGGEKIVTIITDTNENKLMFRKSNASLFAKVVELLNEVVKVSKQ